MTIDSRLRTVSRRSTSGFHRPGRLRYSSTKRDAPWSVRWAAWRVSCILLRTACEADFLARVWQRRTLGLRLKECKTSVSSSCMAWNRPGTGRFVSPRGESIDIGCCTAKLWLPLFWRCFGVPPPLLLASVRSFFFHMLVMAATCYLVVCMAFLVDVFTVYWYLVTLKLWCDMIWYDVMTWYMIWHDNMKYDTWYDSILYDNLWYYMICCDIWYGMIWYNMIWYDVIWNGDTTRCYMIRYNKT